MKHPFKASSDFSPQSFFSAPDVSFSFSFVSCRLSQDNVELEMNARIGFGVPTAASPFVSRYHSPSSYLFPFSSSFPPPASPRNGAAPCFRPKRRPSNLLPLPAPFSHQIFFHVKKSRGVGKPLLVSGALSPPVKVSWPVSYRVLEAPLLGTCGCGFADFFLLPLKRFPAPFLD